MRRQRARRGPWHRAGSGSAAVAAAMLVLCPAPAQAETVLEPADAQELVGLLAEAAAEQDVCYGWDVSIYDGETGRSVRDIGSNWGVGQAAAEDPRCPRHVVLAVDMQWTAESSESEDSATAQIETSIPELDTAAAFDRLGVAEGDFLSDEEDVAVFRATAGLPALVAETGAAPVLTAEPDALAKPEQDALIGRPSPDFVRSYLAGLVVAALALGGAVAWLAYVLFAVPRQRPMPPVRRPPHPLAPPGTTRDPATPGG
ncbi:MAG: hypothetical protein M3P48_02305 [Actinomycetota bacterium]|nr:hypothetical protein [Actinomycetota bacterium]